MRARMAWKNCLCTKNWRTFHGWYYRGDVSSGDYSTKCKAVIPEHAFQSAISQHHLLFASSCCNPFNYPV